MDYSTRKKMTNDLQAGNAMDRKAWLISIFLRSDLNPACKRKNKKLCKPPSILSLQVCQIVNEEVLWTAG